MTQLVVPTTKSERIKSTEPAEISKMTDDQADIPNVGAILAEALRSVDTKLQPFLLAKLERLAAERYRTWASGHPDQSVRDSLLACADREEEIARRVESLEPNASSIQARLLSDHPELLELNRALFDGRPLKVQFAIQAEGERAGAGAWNAFAAAASDPSVQELLKSCSPLEQANADFLQTLL